MNEASVLAQCEEVIEQVMEWLGCQWRRCQIRHKLEDIFDAPVPNTVLDKLIELARQRIRDQLHIDPDEYRGRSLTFYGSVVANERAGLKYRLHAQTRIDKLLGLELTPEGDPHEYAEKLRQAMSEADGTIPPSAETKTEEEPESRHAEAPIDTTDLEAFLGNKTFKMKDPSE